MDITIARSYMLITSESNTVIVLFILYLLSLSCYNLLASELSTYKESFHQFDQLSCTLIIFRLLREKKNNKENNKDETMTKPKQINKPKIERKKT